MPLLAHRLLQPRRARCYKLDPPSATLAIGLTSSQMSTMLSYDAAAGSVNGTFAARGVHDLNMTPDGKAAALKVVDLPLVGSTKVVWPSLAELIFRVVKVADDAKALEPMQYYVREEAWDRWLRTALEVLGPGCTPVPTMVAILV